MFLCDDETGARPDVCSSFPSSSVDLSGQRRYDVALVGHSAGGWVSRLYLSNAAYDGVSTGIIKQMKGLGQR